MTHDQRRQRRKEISDAYIRNPNVGLIASEFGVTTYTVRLACEEFSVRIPRPKTSAQKIRDSVEEGIKSGESVSVMARKLKITSQRVRNAMHELGVADGRVKFSNRSFEILYRLMNSDDTLDAIGLDFGLSHQRIHQIVKSGRLAGFKVRN